MKMASSPVHHPRLALSCEQAPDDDAPTVVSCRTQRSTAHKLWQPSRSTGSHHARPSSSSCPVTATTSWPEKSLPLRPNTAAAAQSHLLPAAAWERMLPWPGCLYGGPPGSCSSPPRPCPCPPTQTPAHNPQERVAVSVAVCLLRNGETTAAYCGASGLALNVREIAVLRVHAHTFEAQRLCCSR